MDIGTAIDRLYNLRATRLDLEQDVKALKAQEIELKGEILTALNDSSLKGAKGSLATASVQYKTTPNVTDWDAVYSYIEQTARFALLHRRISSNLWEAIVQEEGDIPGIEAQTIVDLSLTKSTRS